MSTTTTERVQVEVPLKACRARLAPVKLESGDTLYVPLNYSVDEDLDTQIEEVRKLAGDLTKEYPWLVVVSSNGRRGFTWTKSRPKED